MIRVVIVADVRLYREGLAELLRRDSGVAVAGTAAGWSRGRVLVRELRPDVVVLDMASADGIVAMRSLQDALPDVRIVAVGVSDLERDLIAYAEAGVAGYVTREASLDELVVAIEGAAKGEIVLSPRMAAAVLRRLAEVSGTRGEEAPEPRLTTREHEVVGLIDEGLSNKQIASRLQIEVPTVKNHVHNILEKLGVHGRAEAAARVRNHGVGAGRI